MWSHVAMPLENGKLRKMTAHLARAWLTLRHCYLMACGPSAFKDVLQCVQFGRTQREKKTPTNQN